MYCRAREAELEKQFQSDFANVEADHLQKTQDMLTEFNRAQQILKDKIVKQQKMYVFLLFSVVKLLFITVNVVVAFLCQCFEKSGGNLTVTLLIHIYHAMRSSMQLNFTRSNKEDVLIIINLFPK